MSNLQKVFSWVSFRASLGIFSVFFLVLLLLFGQESQPAAGKGPAFLFLSENAIWEGDFSNFVNQGDGIIQNGRIRFKISIDDNKIIHMSTAFFKPDGSQGDYEGMADMTLAGNKLFWVGEMTQDPSNKNRIENHVFEGYVTADQIYILEKYDDILPSGQVDKRRNALHYYFFEEGKALLVSDVFVNDKLLVFVHTILNKKGEK